MHGYRWPLRGWWCLFGRWFGRGSRLLVIARMSLGNLNSVGGARLVTLGDLVLDTRRGRSMAFWGSFACIFLLIPLF
jgi:hypothetical protein